MLCLGIDSQSLFHLLLQSGEAPIATVMRRLLTGHAVSFNRRHRRTNRLFQNRYKSILCQEDPYLLELVRYIHLNPLRARLVADTDDLEGHPYCGHGAVLGHYDRQWQDRLGISTVAVGYAVQRGEKIMAKESLKLGS